jgi:hypothetical protein
MIRWRKTNRSKLPTNIILSIAVAISTATLEATPARADALPSLPETPNCIEVVNLEKYPEYQIFASSRFRDVILKPGMCLESIRHEATNFYATKKTNLKQLDLTPDSETGQIKGLRSLQTKLFLGKDTSTPDNTSSPFYTGLIHRKVQITELNGDNFKFKTQQYVYHANNIWMFLLVIGLLLAVIAIGLRTHKKISLQKDIK